jgi:hypothetical protein
VETNGKKSSGKRTQALNICYFFLTDQVEKGNITIVYCPTDDMVGDFHTKPLQGKKFCKFGNAILGCEVYLSEIGLKDVDKMRTPNSYI